MSHKFALAFLLLISIVFTALAWSFDEEVSGAWAIEKLSYDGSEEPQVVALSMNVTSSEGVLQGYLSDSVTEEKLPVEISKESETTGVFKFTNDEEGLSTLEFPVNFKTTDLGIHVSSTTTDDSVVDFIILNKNSWILTKVSKADGKVEKWVAKRSDVPVASFFSKYGTMILMMGFFLISNIFKQRMAPQAPQGAPAAPKRD